MDVSIFISFVIVSVLLIVIPGPNILVIVSTSVSHGQIRGLQTVAGTTIAMAIQLLIAAFATAWIVEELTNGFAILKWLGTAYLLYLAWKHISLTFRSGVVATEVTAASSFSNGFLVSLTNPKTIGFFSAFMPQFIVSEIDYVQQMSVLSITFLLLAAMIDSGYALAAAKLQVLLRKLNISKLQHGLSGVLYLGAGIWLALTRRE